MYAYGGLTGGLERQAGGQALNHYSTESNPDPPGILKAGEKRRRHLLRKKSRAMEKLSQWGGSLLMGREEGG